MNPYMRFTIYLMGCLNFTILFFLLQFLATFFTQLSYWLIFCGSDFRNFSYDDSRLLVNNVGFL